jgi:hypothetical protein
MYKDNKNEKTMRKTLSKNSTKRGFHVILQKHSTGTTETQEGSASIKSHPTNTRPRKKARQTDVCYCLGKQSIYTQLAVRQLMCICDCQVKRCIYDLKQGHAREKGSKLRPRVNRRCQAMI